MPDSRNLPDWIDAFMLLTENSEPPVLYRKWCAIGTIAAALQRKVRVDLGISLTFYPNFYIVLVGPSAAGKGTAMRYASDIIDQIPLIRLSAQATSLQALIRRMKQENLTDIDMDTGQQFFHSSMTIFSNEFTVFLGYHNKELIAALCDWYDCLPRWTYDTIKRDKEEIIGVWVNIIGGTTPDNIQSSLPMEAIGGGLTSRIIFVNEGPTDKLVVIPGCTPEQTRLQQFLVSDLEQIVMMSGGFSFRENFLNAYTDWCHEAKKNPPFYDPKFDGYCGRRRNHVMSLAMVCSASRNNELVLELQDFERAAKLLAEVEVKMGLVFRGMGESDIAGLLNGAITFIEKSKESEVPVWRFARYFEGNMDKRSMELVLQTLEEARYVRVVRKPHMDPVIQILERSKIKQTTDPSG